jgi:hypothetical protein
MEHLPAADLLAKALTASASTGICKYGILLHVAVAPQFGHPGIICFSGTEAEKPAGQQRSADRKQNTV